MAAQPITSAHKRPHRFLTIDAGAIALATSLACHWQGLSIPALALGLIGAGTLACGVYQARRQTVRRPETVPPTTADQTADGRISRPHHS
jgi:hypothetical protein